MLYLPRYDHPHDERGEYEPVRGFRAHLAELGAVAAAAVAAGVHGHGEQVRAVEAADEDRDQQASEAAGPGDGAALVERDAAGRLGAGQALDLFDEDRDELDRDDEDEHELVYRNPEPLQRAEDELEAVGQVHEGGREHQHGGDVVEEDHAQPQDPRRPEPLGRDREHPPAPQVVVRVPLVEEDLEEQDEDQEADKERGPSQDVREGHARDGLDQDHQYQHHREAEKAVYEERGDEHREDRSELDPGVHAVDERSRVYELPEDDVSLQ